MSIFGGLHLLYHRKYIRRSLASIPAPTLKQRKPFLKFIYLKIRSVVSSSVGSDGCSHPTVESGHSYLETREGCLEPGGVLPAKQTQPGRGGGRQEESKASKNRLCGGDILEGTRCQSTSVHYSMAGTGHFRGLVLPQVVAVRSGAPSPLEGVVVPWLWPGLLETSLK